MLPKKSTVSSAMQNKYKGPKFGKFLELPQEIRLSIYELALFTGQPIRPHLCDSSTNKVVFHDDGSYINNKTFSGHDSITRLLGITKVSKDIRAEALPCFYSSNTFAITTDTAVYFTHLEMINRFHLIRHVRFTIQMLLPSYAAKMLSSLHKHLKDAAAFPRFTTEHPFYGKRPATYLRDSPEYRDSGTEFAPFIVLRKLGSASTDDGARYTHNVAIPVPRATIFSHEYPNLTWFATVAHGMGTHLQYVEGKSLAFSDRHVIAITWEQAFQKKDFGEAAGKDVDVRQRALELLPGAEKAPVWKLSYMRTRCDGQSYFWRNVGGWQSVER
jgi:hypothetical protein